VIYDPSGSCTAPIQQTTASSSPTPQTPKPKPVPHYEGAGVENKRREMGVPRPEDAVNSRTAGTADVKVDCKSHCKGDTCITQGKKRGNQNPFARSLYALASLLRGQEIEHKWKEICGTFLTEWRGNSGVKLYAKLQAAKVIGSTSDRGVIN
jgi:hypothetical protein